MDSLVKAYRIIPAVKDNIWGGTKLLSYGKTTDSDRIAESWELSFTKGGESRLADGVTLEKAFPKERWGTLARDFEFFPVLTKFIDAKDRLSVQVHPSDEYALKNEGQYGKTEMWYVVEAEEGAGLYLGFCDSVDKELLRASAKDGSIERYLRFVPVKAGDVFFIPSGTVHAIGAGVLIYEVQQNSTLTYRLYDYLRRDKDGNPRELHVDKAMEVLLPERYEDAPRVNKNGDIIGSCKYFTTRKYKQLFTSYSFNIDERSFLFITVLDGEGFVDGKACKKGDGFFCPAGVGEVVLDGDLDIITVSLC